MVSAHSGSGMTTGNSAAPRSVWPGFSPAELLASAQRIPANLVRWFLVLLSPPRAQPPRWSAGIIIAAFTIVAAVVASMVFVDTAASDWARHLPRWIAEAADEITNLGRSGIFLYPLGFILVILAAIVTPTLPRMAQGLLASLVVRFGFLFFAIGLPSLFVTIVKRLIGRARPYVGPHDDPFVYLPFVWKPEYASMPSGHATTAAAAAIAIGAIWPRMRAVMWLYVLVIMLSRILIGVHHPSDVVAAVLVGAVGAQLVRRWFAARGLGFSGIDLRAYPWPSWRRLRAAAGLVFGGSALPAN
jgi:membrane-associated phospholipid phosphatase